MLGEEMEVVRGYFGGKWWVGLGWIGLPVGEELIEATGLETIATEYVVANLSTFLEHTN